MITDLAKTCWPWFGGKTHAAPAVWDALGDVHHYVEPFFGGGAVLLRRPHPCNRTYYSETVNDLDGFLCNAWRSIKADPQSVAEAASWPVSECDVHARHLALLKWKTDAMVERLMGDPDFCDPRVAGWWVWGQCSWIGSGWCSGQGPWVVGADGRITKRPKGVDGDGVWRQRPHVGDDGMGVNHAGTREPGVSRQLPHVSNDGMGVNRPQLREPGVSRQLPHVSDNGMGVNRPQLREPGVSGSDEITPESEFHPMTMPELRRWLDFLGARMRHVRILCGDWTRAVTTGAAWSLPVRQGHGPAGVFLDPPYAHSVRDATLYTEESSTVAADCRRWCLANGGNPKFRIVLAGFAGEGHEELEAHGWRVAEWFTGGHLRGGMANTGGNGHQQQEERLWLSPHCLTAEAAPVPAPRDDTPDLFADLEDAE